MVCKDKLSFLKPRSSGPEAMRPGATTICQPGIHSVRFSVTANPGSVSKRLWKRLAASTSDFVRDEHGGVLVEATVLIPIIFTFVLGSVDFLFAFYQWNAAAKAAELGARIAAVSTPVIGGLQNVTGTGSSSFPSPQPVPYFKVTCSSVSSSCSCVGACTGVAGYNAAAMNTIIFGRGSSACGDATSSYYAGMCDIFKRVALDSGHVRIVYEQTGLGYLGRAEGPVPTITVSLQDLPFEFYFLGGLMGFADIPNIPASATITGEDLNSNGGP
jgi:hypothetical protein